MSLSAAQARLLRRPYTEVRRVQEQQPVEAKNALHGNVYARQKPEKHIPCHADHFRRLWRAERPHRVDEGGGGNARREQRRASRRIRPAAGNSSHAEMLEPKVASEFRDVARPIDQCAVVLKGGKPKARPLGRDDPDAQTPRRLVHQPEHEPRSGRSMETEDREPTLRAIFRVAQFPAVGQDDVTVFGGGGIACRTEPVDRRVHVKHFLPDVEWGARLDICLPPPMLAHRRRDRTANDVTGRTQDGRLPSRYMDPFQAFRGEVDRLFDDFPGGLPTFSNLRQTFPTEQTLTPALDVKETEKELDVRTSTWPASQRQTSNDDPDGVLTIGARKRASRRGALRQGRAERHATEAPGAGESGKEDRDQEQLRPAKLPRP